MCNRKQLSNFNLTLHSVLRIRYYLLILLFVSLSCLAQDRNPGTSLATDIRHNFNYDTLSTFSCLNTPVGVYAIKFRVDKQHRFYDFSAANDSLVHIQRLFIHAIRKSNSSAEARKLKQGTYLQLIYFNNTLSCHPFRNRNNLLITVPPDTSTSVDGNYDKEIISLLSTQLVSIEKTFASLQQSGFTTEPMIWLPPVIIGEKKADMGKPGFRNDIKPSPRTTEQIEQKIQEHKKKKQQK